MVVIFKVLNEELEGLNAKARKREATIVANVAETPCDSGVPK